MPVPLRHLIDWGVIADATRFYQAHTFRPVEVPWVVPPSVTRATIPAGVEARTTQDGDLIGSGEQGFLYLASQGLLGDGLYQTTTPCFRDDVEDAFHGKHFVKVELIHISPTPDLHLVLHSAQAFFGSYMKVLLMDVGGGQIDIVDAHTGTELGSYGIRESLGVRWAYGTGVAEPRFSQVRAVQPHTRPQ